MSGFASSGFSVGAGSKYGAIKMAIIGGTVSEIGGGKFSNGAMGSAFQFMLNDMASFKKSMSQLGTKLTDGTITTRNPTAETTGFAVRNIFDMVVK